VQLYLRQRRNLFVASPIHQCKPAPAVQPVNLSNVEKRKVAPLGIGGLRNNFLQTGYAAGVKIPILKTLETFYSYVV